MLITLLVALALTVPQDPHKAMNDRGAHVMGFDQEKTAHHFLLFDDGGAIEIAVKDAADVANRNAIRSHLPHISAMFSEGNFEAPMLIHDTKTVPGITTLTARKQMVTYRYVETAAGGRVEIVTKDASALKALHEFLRYQIQEHQTGDPGTITSRR
jgi:hypothetical protein